MIYNRFIFNIHVINGDKFFKPFDNNLKNPLKDKVGKLTKAQLKAIAEKNGVQIQPAGAHAANLAGLSEQVPGRLIFLTEGPSRKLKIGNQEIILKKTIRAD